MPNDNYSMRIDTSNTRPIILNYTSIWFTNVRSRSHANLGHSRGFVTRIKYICRRNRLKSRWANWIKYHLFRPLFLCCLERQEVRQSWDLVCESPLNPGTSHEHCKPKYTLCSREYGTKEMHGNRTKFIITVIGKTPIIIKLFIIHLIKRSNNKIKKKVQKEMRSITIFKDQ